jgi:hypothetical protein
MKKEGIRIAVPKIFYWLVFVLCVNSIALILNNYLMFALLGRTGPE